MIKRSMREIAAVKEQEPLVGKRLEARLKKLEEVVLFHTSISNSFTCTFNRATLFFRNLKK